MCRCSWWCCVGWLFALVVIGGVIYGLLSLIIPKTQRGGEFSLDSAYIQSMNLSNPNKIDIVMKLNITSRNPNRIPGLIEYDSLDFVLYFQSFNLLKSFSMEPFQQTHLNTTHFSTTLKTDSSQPPMPNDTLKALESSTHSGSLSLHLRINIAGRLSGNWKKCSLKSNDDCYFSLLHIAPNGTGGTLSEHCSWTSGCE